MMAIIPKILLGSALATTALAHSHVNNLVINGVYWQGYDPTSYPYMTDPPIVVGWTAGDTDNGFVSPDAYQTGDIICHKNATPAGGHALVNAGDSISVQWAVTWPDSHKGPVLDYLAPCNGPCETVDKTTLEWFKIDNLGYINGSDPGTWASDVLIGDSSTWLVRIPASIAPGNYVLRHEIIALHSAGSANGAQNYPQCFNLAVSGTGSLKPSGTLGEALYNASDPGILYNLYTTVESYVIPGPTLNAAFPSTVPQSSSAATTTSSPVLPGASTPAASSTGVAATTTGSSGSVKSTTTAASTPTSTTKVTTTTTTKATTTKATTTTAVATGAGQELYAQCGGSGWTGATSCVGGVCTTYNAYYAQCVPSS
ncbi:unnamed protein product [Discula destructiva]